MTRSEGLRKEVQAMAAVEQALTGLPPRSRYRVVGWILDNYAEPDAPEPERNHIGAEAASLLAGTP